MIWLYLIYGTINIFIIEWVLDFVDKRIEGGMENKIEFTTPLRIIMIFLWPIFTFVFWFNFIKSWINK